MKKRLKNVKSGVSPLIDISNREHRSRPPFVMI